MLCGNLFTLMVLTLILPLIFCPANVACFLCLLHTVNSEIFVRVLFSKNFADSWASEEKGYLFSGSWGALVII